MENRESAIEKGCFNDKGIWLNHINMNEAMCVASYLLHRRS